MNTRVAFVFVALFAIAFTGCGRSSPGVAATPAITVSGPPADVAPRATRALQPLLAKQTEVVRVDRANEVVLRFSMIGGDGSVRLVEVTLQSSTDSGRTTVTAISRAFSFVMKPARGRLDAETEVAVLALVRKSTETAALP